MAMRTVSKTVNPGSNPGSPVVRPRGAASRPRHTRPAHTRGGHGEPPPPEDPLLFLVPATVETYLATDAIWPLLS
jgi:hypothetical protein